MTTTVTWADELRQCLHPSARPIPWHLWAQQTITALRSIDSGEPCDAERGERAATMLREIASYLDDQYNSGYDGIAIMPLSGFNLSFDR